MTDLGHYRTYVRPRGGVVLSDFVCCDGFVVGRKVRVQTHIHSDHKNDFEISKGYMDVILASEPTKDLLIAYDNGDLPYRTNFLSLPPRIPAPYFGEKITLVESGHMLGGVQVLVEHSNGYRSMYSSDFAWPPPNGVPHCDELVVDATYGEDSMTRGFDSDKVAAEVIRIVDETRGRGVIRIIGHRGRLQHAMSILSGEFPHMPFYSSARTEKTTHIYRKWGIPISPVDILEFRHRSVPPPSSGIVFYETGEWRNFPDRGTGTRINLSYGYGGDFRSPVTWHKDGESCSIAFTDHADFIGTLKYVEASGASRVVTDSSRGGNAHALAIAIKRELGIEAQAAEPYPSHEWGSG